MLFIFSLWYKVNFSQNCLLNTLFLSHWFMKLLQLKLNLVFYRSCSYILCQYHPFLWWFILFQHFLRYSHLLVLYDKLSHLVSHPLKKISLGVWDGTKPIFLGRKIYIFILSILPFKDKVCLHLLKCVLCLSVLYMFFHEHSYFSMNASSVIYLPPPCVAITGLTSSVLSFPLYHQIVNWKTRIIACISFVFPFYS